MGKQLTMDDNLVLAKNAKKKDGIVNEYVTLRAIRGEQFGKELYSSVIRFKDLLEFLEVFPEVQRNTNKRKVSSVKQYILSWLDNPKLMRFFPAITVTSRGHMFYSDNKSEVAIDTAHSRLSVNDGQHRFFGAAEAIRELQGRMNKTNDKVEIEKIKGFIKIIEDMILPMTIFANLSEAEEKQLFHDTNVLGSRPSRSSTIKLAQTDEFSIMARELAEENAYLKKYGVEFDKTSIQSNNTNTILLTTIYEMARRLVWDATKKGNSAAIRDDKKYMEVKEYVNDTINSIFDVLPPDLAKKGKYIIEKNYSLKAIARFIHDCRKKQIPETAIFQAIDAVNWELDYNYWKQFGGHENKSGMITFGSSGDHGRVSVAEALNHYLSTIVVIKEVSAASGI